MSITHVVGQQAHCKECGELGDVYLTPINKAGPYCAECINEAAETEEHENSQHGVGA